MTKNTDQNLSPANQPLVEDDDHFDSQGVAIIGAGHAAHDTYSAFLSPLLPVFMDTMSFSRSMAGTLSLFVRWPSLLQPVIGNLSDRYHLKELFILAPAVTATAMSLLGIAPSYAVMAMLLLVAGLGSASMHAVGPAIAAKISGNKLGLGMSYWMVGGELGRALGPIIVVTAVEWFGLSGMPWLMFGGIAASFLLWLQLRDVSNGKHASESKALPWRDVIKSLRPLLIPLAALVMARSFMVTALGTYLPILMRDQGASIWLAGAALTIFEIAGIVGALTGGSISDRIGRRTVIVVSMLVTPLLMFAFLAVSGILELVLLLALGFTALSVTPVLMAVIQEAAPKNRALATGIFLAMGIVMSSITVVVLGAIGDTLGMQQAYIISAIMSLVGLPIVFLLPNLNPGRKDGNISK
jgi:MFS transporter, FSR family, fosmidomycin resistance protein